MCPSLYTAHPAGAHQAEPVVAHASACRLGSDPDVVLVRVSGEIDLDTVHVVHTALNAYRARRTVVDLSRCSFADSSLFHALLDAHRHQHLVLAGPYTRQLEQVLTLTGATALVPLAPDSAAAVRMQ
ncbi:STAS domain-containing protein [Streptomyces sp. NPDC002033]|uniref:STAS domain-containing protein n=1 Tax=unclassified Streptomyces TaxID=2593676 RepID=UPI00332BB67F